MEGNERPHRPLYTSAVSAAGCAIDMCITSQEASRAVESSSAVSDETASHSYDELIHGIQL